MMNTDVCKPSDEQNESRDGLALWQMLPEDSIGIIARMSSTLSWRMLCMVGNAFTELPKYKNKPYRYLRFNITEKAAKSGYASIMQLGIELGHPCSKETIGNAIMSGNRKCFDSLPDIAFQMVIRRALTAAAAVGSIDMFETILAKNTASLRDKLNTMELYRAAARGNHIDMLEYLYANYRRILDKKLAKVAVKAGSEEALFWVIDHKLDNIHVNTSIYFHIAMSFPRNDVMRIFLKVYNHPKVSDSPLHLPQSSMLAAAIFRDIPELVKWFKDHNQSLLRSSASHVAAKRGWIDILKQCVQNRYSHTWKRAIAADHPEIIQYLAEKSGHEITLDDVFIAVMSASIKILEYFATIPGVFDIEAICNRLVGVDNVPLGVLKWMHRRGYTIHHLSEYDLSDKAIVWIVKKKLVDTTTALIIAARMYSWQVAAWIEPNPRKWADEVYDAVCKYSTHSLSMYSYARNRGCHVQLYYARRRFNESNYALVR